MLKTLYVLELYLKKDYIDNFENSGVDISQNQPTSITDRETKYIELKEIIPYFL